MGTSAEQTEQKKALMLTALGDTLGNVSEACTKANASRTQHYEWIKEDSEYKQSVDDIDEAQIDMSESLLKRRCRGYKYEEIKTEIIGEKSQLDKDPKSGTIVKKTITQKVMPPNVDALKTHLGAKAPNRGYGNKLHVGGIKDAPPIEITSIKIITRNESGDSGNDSSEKAD